MVLSTNKIIMLNAAAVLITVAAVGAVVRSFVVAPDYSPCEERYRSVMTFPLERNGELLSPADLQARVGGREAGLLENVEVLRLVKAPAAVGLKVNMPKGSASPHMPDMPVGGMSFPWLPRAINGKTAACLTYHLLLPADFDTQQGGFLPGFIGTDPAANDKESFVARLLWGAGGVGGIANRVVTEGTRVASKEPDSSFLQQIQVTNRLDAEPQEFDLVRGRWMRIEQEIVLNRPKISDGTLRVWVDGRRVVDRTDMLFRLDPGVTLAGVAADIFYVGEDPSQAAPKDTTVFVSPFQLRWQ